MVDFAYPAVPDGDVGAVVEHYKSLADRSRLVSGHGPFLDLYLNSPDPAIRRVATKRINSMLTVADELKLQFVVFHTTACRCSDTPPIRALGGIACAILERGHRRARHHRPAREHVDKSPELIARVLDGVSSPRLKVCLDTGHHLLFSTEPLERWFQVLGENIAYLHLTDNLGDVDNELALGTGVVNWPELTRLIARDGDQPQAVIETPNLERIRGLTPLPGGGEGLSAQRALRAFAAQRTSQSEEP